MNIGQAIRTERKRCRLSQMALACDAGVSQLSITWLENNKYSPTISMLTKLCDVLHVSVSSVIKEAEEYD